MSNAAPLWHPKHWPVWLGVGVLSLLASVPFKIRNSLAAGLARLMFRPMAKQTRVARLNLELCFPDSSAEEIEALLRLNYCRYMQVLIQLPMLWWSTGEQLSSRVKTRGEEHLATQYAVGKGCVLLYTHTMALEFGATELSVRYKMQGIYNPFNNQVIDYLFERGRKRFGGRVVARGEGFRATLKLLAAGVSLVYLCDEDFGPKGSVFAPFFGQPKATLSMLPRMVQHTDSPVLPIYTNYDPETDLFVTTICAPIADYPDDDPVMSAQKMNAAIESTVRDCPEQYLWKLRLFRTMPDGGPSRYTDIRQK